MPDLERLAKLAHDSVDPMWTRRDTDRALGGFMRKRRRRRVRNGAAGVAALAAVVWAGFSIGQHHAPVPELAAAAPAPAPASTPAAPAMSVLHLRDGSTVRATRPDTELRVVEDGDGRSAIGLLRGGARFDVVRRDERSFIVEVHDVRVTVIGTSFSVEDVGPEVEVAVASGVVRVQSGKREWRLRAGDVRRVPARAEQPTAKVVPARGAPQAPRQEWRAFVHEGRYDEAFAALGGAQPVTLAESATLLMEAADAARYSGHPREAVGYLEAVLERQPGDPLAALAAFTLGRLQLEKLGAPADAARRFAEAQRLTSNESLAQDALAREVESWAKAGDMAAARQRAGEYLRRFPDGPRAGAVRALGGVE